MILHEALARERDQHLRATYGAQAEARLIARRRRLARRAARAEAHARRARSSLAALDR